MVAVVGEVEQRVIAGDLKVAATFGRLHWLRAVGQVTRVVSCGSRRFGDLKVAATFWLAGRWLAGRWLAVPCGR